MGHPLLGLISLYAAGACLEVPNLWPLARTHATEAGARCSSRICSVNQAPTEELDGVV